MYKLNFNTNQSAFNNDFHLTKPTDSSIYQPNVCGRFVAVTLNPPI